jgi:thiol-disulfide isomerase/thioredoxin
VPILIRSLDDPDLRMVATAEAALMRVSGEDYGVRASQAIPSPAHPGQIDPANIETIRRGVEKRKEWWRDHQREYEVMGEPPVRSAGTRLLSSPRPAAPDFKLADLKGKTVSLSQFRGKVVLLNFWATWCTACLAELPDLEALQQKMGNQIVILGVSLDGVPDEEGDTPGEDAGGGSHKGRPSVNALRAKVERAVRARRINYPVLLDPKNSVGGQYNGGELPTTVILDADGRVRRRFIGERSLTVFEAMIAEASRAPGAVRQFNGDSKSESAWVGNAN